MDALKTIHTRRSIRKYQKKKIPAELIEKILRAGMAAPSAHNEQPWHFVVVTDKKTLTLASKISPYAAMIEEAPLAILVCGDLNLERGRVKGFWIQDCAAAVQNMLLAAAALGLGAVWTGIYPAENLVGGHRQLFGLPENIIPFALAAFGYPAEKPAEQDRFKPERVRYN
ncbi:MAG: nitroreductase family protein [bacterium]|nr:nitroreductase family protein [bacterium]